MCFIRVTPFLLDNELIAKWREVASKFGDERRTKILNLSEEGAEPIERKQITISICNTSSAYCRETSTLYSQKRNGVGAKFKLEKDEYVIESLWKENYEWGAEIVKLDERLEDIFTRRQPVDEWNESELPEKEKFVIRRWFK